MKSVKILILMMCLVFLFVSGSQAQLRWQMGSVSEFSISFIRQTDESGIAIYKLGSGAVWLLIKLPRGSQPLDLSRPFEISVDSSKAFAVPDIRLQPNPTSVGWELVAPESDPQKSALVGRLMKGNMAHVLGFMTDGRKVKMAMPLNNSGTAIKALLATRP